RVARRRQDGADGHGDHGDREEGGQPHGRQRPAPRDGSDREAPVPPEGYLHPARSKMRTASSFSSPRTVRSSVSATKSPHDWRVADQATSGCTGYSWFASAKISCASGLVRNSRSAMAFAGFCACRVTPAPLTFTCVPRPSWFGKKTATCSATRRSSGSEDSTRRAT